MRPLNGYFQYKRDNIYMWFTPNKIKNKLYFIRRENRLERQKQKQFFVLLIRLLLNRKKVYVWREGKKLDINWVLFLKTKTKSNDMKCIRNLFRGMRYQWSTSLRMTAAIASKCTSLLKVLLLLFEPFFSQSVDRWLILSTNEFNN